MTAIGNPASIDRRILSFMIDEIVASFLFIAIFYDQISMLSNPLEVQQFIGSEIWVLILLKVIYHTFFIWQNGMTLGKYLARIKAVSALNGDKLTLQSSFFRAAARIPDEFVFYLGFLPALFSPTKQTVHDKISNCVVIDA